MLNCCSLFKNVGKSTRRMEKKKKSDNELNESESLIETAVDPGPDLEGIWEKGLYVCYCHVLLESL